MDGLRARIDALRVGKIVTLARKVELPDPSTFDDVAPLREVADVLAAAPNLSADALTAAVWDDNADDVQGLVALGFDFKQRASDLAGPVFNEALLTSVDGLETQLAWLPQNFPADAFERARRLANLLPRMSSDVERLKRELGSSAEVNSFAAVSRMVSMGERVAAAPDASPEAFAAAVWDHGVEQAGDLADAVAVLEAVSAEIGDCLFDAAWNTDVTAARQALAMHTGMFRHFNGGWRKAKALVRAIVTTRDMPAQQLVELLDKLTKAQVAAKAIRDGDAFGRLAFGADWRGERSASAPLRALVEWMRTLRGLGAEPRLIAGRLAERSEVRERSAQLQLILDETLCASARSEPKEANVA